MSMGFWLAVALTAAVLVWRALRGPQRGGSAVALACVVAGIAAWLTAPAPDDAVAALGLSLMVAGGLCAAILQLANMKWRFFKKTADSKNE